MNKVKKETILEIYIGNKLIERHLPVLIVAAEAGVKWHSSGEHFIFTGIDQLPLVCRRDEISARDDMFDGTIYGKFPNVFSAEAVFNRQLQNARNHLEAEMWKLNKPLHKEIFWEGRPFEFEKTDRTPLIELQIEGLYERELRMMNRETEIEDVRMLCKELLSLPKLNIKRVIPGESR